MTDLYLMNPTGKCLEELEPNLEAKEKVDDILVGQRG